jgi:hypothetical protein
MPVCHSYDTARPASPCVYVWVFPCLFCARSCLQIADFEVDGPDAKEPLDALNGLFGIDSIRERLEGYGRAANVWQREGRSTAGIVGNMVFTGAE